MEQQSISKLQFYSLGIVSVNKPLSTKVIEVTPIEYLPMLNGEITDNVSKYKSSSTDADGSVSSIEIDTTVSIQATWLPINNSNRYTAPDVRRGETVVIYRFADTDRYWWNTMHNDIMLRRLETVVYAFSNNRAEDIANDASNTYFLEISTHRKLVHFHTSNNDGEPFAYDIQINTKDGVIIITDDTGNTFELNSAERRLFMKNSDETIVDIDKQNITMTASESITFNAKKIASNASEKITDTTPLVDVYADTSLNGNIGVSGTGYVNMELTTGNGITAGGDVNISGAVNASDFNII